MRAAPIHSMARAVLSCAMLFWASAAASQSKSTPAELFAELESEKTADQAGMQLRKLAKSDPAARQYLATNLPALVEHGPKAHLAAWRNAVQIAGDLRLVEAVPALAKWLGLDTGPGFGTLAEEARLDRNWPGKALVQIGDPSVPSVQNVLEHGTSRERWTAAFVLDNIGSQRARAALREHRADEPDESLRSFILKALSNHKRSGPS